MNVSIQRTVHLSRVIPANYTRESVFGLRNFPRREQGLNLGPLAPEASALTTELPHFYVGHYVMYVTECGSFRLWAVFVLFWGESIRPILVGRFGHEDFGRGWFRPV